jgi:hypothetical protein
LLEDLEQDNIVERQFSQEVPETLGGVSGWIVKEGMMEEWQRRRQVLLNILLLFLLPPLSLPVAAAASSSLELAVLSRFLNSLCYLASSSLFSSVIAASLPLFLGVISACAV